jgi:hypothetical protein
MSIATGNETQTSHAKGSAQNLQELALVLQVLHLIVINANH